MYARQLRRLALCRLKHLRYHVPKYCISCPVVPRNFVHTALAEIKIGKRNDRFI